MDPHVVLTCPVTVFSRCALGNLTPIGNHSRLTINYVEGYGQPESIIVYDEHRHERLKILVETEAVRYKIVDRFNHEIMRLEDTTIILVFYQEDEYNVRAFANLMEMVFMKLHRFIYSCSSWSESDDNDDDPNNGAVCAQWTPRPATPIVTFWECENCHFETPDDHSCDSWVCRECGRPRE